MADFHFKRAAAVAGAFALLTLGSALARADAGPVTVLYAGSLVNVMERSIGPAFEQASGTRFAGYAAGSKRLAQEIKGKLRAADVFISASPQVNDTLRGAANGDWVNWSVTFGMSPLGLGYRSDSRFAQRLKSERFDQVLCAPGLRLGRTDPKLDPKGALTVAVIERAEALYKHPGLSQCALGGADNPAQILPEETLLGRLQSGQLDAGFFYSVETAAAHLPFTPLPRALGVQATYTVTIVNHAPHGAAAARFVAFLLGPQGRALLARAGVDPLPLAVSGERGAVPAAVRAVLPNPDVVRAVQ